MDTKPLNASACITVTQSQGRFPTKYTHAVNLNHECLAKGANRENLRKRFPVR